MGAKDIPFPGSETVASEPILTPSEVVFLAGEGFVPPGGILGEYKLPGGARVSTVELARGVFAAAFLAAEKAGTLQLEIRSHKVFFGLRNAEVLYAEPGNGTDPYPKGSLESLLPLLVRQLREKEGQSQVWRVTYNCFSKDSINPFAAANDLIQSNLAERGLLEVSQTKFWIVNTRTEVRVPARTQIMVERRVNDVIHLLHECGVKQPAVWGLLINSIDQGLRARNPPD